MVCGGQIHCFSQLLHCIGTIAFGLAAKNRANAFFIRFYVSFFLLSFCCASVFPFSSPHTTRIHTGEIGCSRQPGIFVHPIVCSASASEVNGANLHRINGTAVNV